MKTHFSDQCIRLIRPTLSTLIAILCFAILAVPATPTLADASPTQPLTQPLAPSNELVIQKGDRIAIVGDSITEQKLYSRFMELYLLACVPQLELTTYQFGWGGERAPGFATRLQNDMAPWQPTVVTTCYGMNDGRYRTYNDDIGAAYEKGTRSIQEQSKQLGVRTMIVGGPGVVDADTWRPNDPEADQHYNDNLAKLSEIAGRVAQENNFVYAPLHTLMLQTMQDAKAELGPAYHVAGRDGVHPYPNGHIVMAYAFLKAMGFDGHIGTITVDAKNNSLSASATDGHRVLSTDNGTLKIESTRYPFCFHDGKDNDPTNTRSILPFIPFNADLNRFMLIVNNLSEPTADITWGSQTKTFTKTELEAGINLADAFLDNPFSATFKTLSQAVAHKQKIETYTIKHVITHFRSLINDFPDDPEVGQATAILRRKLLERNAQDAANVRAAVTPVTHAIIITPTALEPESESESESEPAQ